MKTKIVKTLVGIESEVHAFFARQVREEIKDKAACMLLATISNLYSEGGKGQYVRHCEYANALCGGHEFSTNGARIYLDHNRYLEYSTPPCTDTLEAVASIRAGDRIISRAIVELRTKLKKESNAQSVLAIRNNIDYAGHSYGTHVNVRMSRKGFDRIYEDKKLREDFIIPFFITLPIICGSGRCSSEKGEDIFQIWQRADFINDENLVSLNTMGPKRPLINSRDEPLSVDPNLARFHIIAFDANRMEVAEYLKLGLLKLLCAAIDADRCNVSLKLKDPLRAIQRISHKPFEPIELEEKEAGSMSAVEIQRLFYNSFQKLFQQGIYSDRIPDAQEILVRWDDVLTALEKDPFGLLVGKIDWITKFLWLEKIRSAKGLTWNSSDLKWLDIQYHIIGGSQAPVLPQESLIDKNRIKSLITHAPKNSRAALRGELIRRFNDSTLLLNWHYLITADGQFAMLIPDDPDQKIFNKMERLDMALSLTEAADLLELERIELDLNQSNNEMEINPEQDLHREGELLTISKVTAGGKEHVNQN